VSRTDLTEDQIRALTRRCKKVLDDSGVWSVTKPEADQILRLTGEVLELRNREAATRQQHALEWDEY
jgi:chromosome condensin MukBEF complex kleisin-like MukF subunit